MLMLLVTLLISSPAAFADITCRVVEVAEGDTIKVLDNTNTEH